MYVGWYNHVKRKYEEETKLCYIDTDSSTFYVKRYGTSKDVAEYV